MKVVQQPDRRRADLVAENLPQENGEAATQYTAKGWAVIPLHSIRDGDCTCGKADCSSPGKHPRTAHGLKDATRDHSTIADWWREWPDANVGIVTGAESGIVVIDIDPRHGGKESLKELEAEFGQLPVTVESVTGGGGCHIFFQHPGATVKNRTNLRPGIDVRGDGGYIVAPPSDHTSGDVYRWDEGRAPDESEIASMPAWLLGVLKSDPVAHHNRNGAPTSCGLLLQRAQQYAASADAVGEGSRNPAAYSLAGHLVAFIDDDGNRLLESQILDIVRQWNQRNSLPLSDWELQQCVASALSNGTPRPDKLVVAGGGLDRLIIGSRNAPQQNADLPRVNKFTLADLQQQHPKLPPPVIDGLAREGETVNIIAPSKIGKSWLGYDLALSVITGNPWLDTFQTSRGRVLLIDNELHPPTIAHRFTKVGDAMELFPVDYNEKLDVWPLRGRLCSLLELLPDFEEIKRGDYKLIILDAKYRFNAPGVSENDNDPALYNLLDQYAEQTGAAIVVIHHSSKGNQAGKRVTDIGAGGGVQSRAADCHLVLREHEEEDVFVLDAAVRSFPPVEPVALRWDFPLWSPATSVDTSKLEGRLTAREQRQKENDREAMDKVIAALQDGPRTARKVGEKTGLSRDRRQRILDLMVSEGALFTRDIVVRGNACSEYHLSK